MQNLPEHMLPLSIESAAHDAAIADCVLPPNPNFKAGEIKVKKAGLRRGKWTTEEEAYSNRLIMEFKLGLLPLTDGTTLRTFLSKLLNCDPMRISKKFVGQNCIGKVMFRIKNSIRSCSFDVFLIHFIYFIFSFCDPASF
jgi:hypothetical protein